MIINGATLIGGSAVMETGDRFAACDPSTGESFEPVFGASSVDDLDRACMLADRAFDRYRETSAALRADFLEAIAQGVNDLGPTLIERAMRETGLPKARLEGERARTVGQLRLFAELLRDGRWVDAIIDRAQPDRVPARRPDLRMRKIAIGPVAVFGASNFPLAFSVAGGDTASALAAGCPVVVKAHPAHPGTSELVGRVIQAAVRRFDLPDGVFSMLVGAGHEIGQRLVQHPAIRAVGFTGSRQGGLALMRATNARPDPIPVHAEMSSINPVFLMPAKLAEEAESIARSLVESLTLGTGQFCTNPGLVLGIEGPTLDRFRQAAAAALSDKQSTVMLTSGIHAAYVAGVRQLSMLDGVSTVAVGQTPSIDKGFAARPALFATQVATLLTAPGLSQEIFGPAGVVVACQDIEEMRLAAEHLEGQLTATVYLAADDHADVRRLLPVLERKVGRILFNGVPTGVEVAHAMVHGGPFPATSDSRTTSVGTLAIERFLRPVCYQDMPPELLAPSLADDNPLGLWRLVDGQRTHS